MIFILIGMPGAGKSSLGRIAAKRLKMKMIDTDRLIERREGMLLHQILEQKGKDGFAIAEEEALMSIREDNVIISTGGSAVYYDRAMNYFKSIGKIIYLYASLPSILERIGDYSKRGIVIPEGQTFEELYRDRCALYERYADAIVDCDGRAYPKLRNRLFQTLKAFIESEH